MQSKSFRATSNSEMITLCGCHKEFEIDNEYQNIIDEIKLILIYKYVVLFSRL